MNIFVTDPCPVKSAQFLDNKRLNKMCLETAQLLSTALRLSGYSGNDVYKISHRNHPSNVWCRTTRGNYQWLLKHFRALCDEYTRRTNKIHASSKLFGIFRNNINLLPNGNQTPFSNNARNLTKGVDFTMEQDVFTAYKLYLNARWENDKKEPQWS
jgi:hypothetical protein